jgi:hypothetical protein
LQARPFREKAWWYLANVTDAETPERGYAFTGDAGISHRHRARCSLADGEQSLRKLTADNVGPGSASPGGGALQARIARAKELHDCI